VLNHPEISLGYTAPRDLPPLSVKDDTYRQHETHNPLRPNEPWGLTFLHPPPKGVITILYQNIYRYPDDPYTSLTDIKSKLAPDVICLCEMSTNLTKQRRDKIWKDFKTGWDNATLSLGHTPDNFMSKKYKPGGVGTIAVGPFTSRVIAKGRDDIGRWAWLSMSIPGPITLTIVTIYRQCQMTLSTAGSITYYIQLYRQHILQGASHTVNPRQKMVHDLTDFLATLHDYQLILTMDANEDTTNRDPVSIFTALENIGLVSAYNIVDQSATTLPQTYTRGSQCIDYIYVTQPILNAIQSVTIHPFGLAFNSAHRPVTVQLKTGRIHHDLTRAQYRSINTMHIKRVEAFNLYLHNKMHHHKLHDRITTTREQMAVGMSPELEIWRGTESIKKKTDMLQLRIKDSQERPTTHHGPHH